MKYDAVILAGGESTSNLRKIAPYRNEALIKIGKYPMIYYVYRALRQSASIRTIVISGPVDALKTIFPREEKLLFACSGENAIASFSNAIDVLQQYGISDRILVMPTDIPLITTPAIDDFIRRSEEIEADFYYSITTKEINDIKFPGVTRTYVKLKEGTFTGGNLFIVNRSVIKRVLDMALKLVMRRKNPLAMARLFGLNLVIRYITRQLSIEATEKRFQEVVGIKGKAIISPYAEVGIDVDKPSDLQLAQKHLLDICS